MDKALAAQVGIRENSTELNDFLKDLTRWEEKVKTEDENLKTARKLEEKLPPIRSKVKKSRETKKQIDKKAKPNRISSYDYDAWSKFDADAACESDSNEENQHSDSEDEAEDEEEIEKIKQERRLQQALMEKDKGNQLFKEGKYEAAINRYTSAIGLHPTNPILYANRGMALIKTEKFGAAEQDCNLALELDPNYGKAIARRGAARKKLKKYKDALNDYTHLLKLEPKNQQAQNEIKSIEKIIATNKKNNLAKGNTSATQDQGDSTGETNQKRRKISEKPLKRIYITEVGIDEADIDKEKEGSQHMNGKVHQIEKTVTESTPPVLEITVPTTSFMFETTLKRFRNDNENLYLYLKIIPLTEYCKLFNQCVDSLISPFLDILKCFYIRDGLSYHKEMDAFTAVNRFEMAAMFLSSKDKLTLNFLFSKLSSDSYNYTLEKGFLNQLASKYNVKL